MRKVEMYWMSKREWWEFDENLEPVVRKDAPPEAQASYKRYLKTANDDE